MLQNRRHFLRTLTGGSALLSLTPGAPGWLVRAAAETRADRDGTVLVVLQLSGGNDGLNCVVPFTHDAYQRARPTLRLPAREVLRLTDELGLHPKLAGFKALYDAGHLAIVQGVGCPKLSREHDRAMRTWHVADPEPDGRETGWVGRAADAWAARTGGIHTPALFVGGIARPFALNAARSILPVVRHAGEMRSRTEPPPPGERPAPADRPLLAHVRRVAASARAQEARLRALAAEAGAGDRGYPDFALARDLRLVARLIRADLGTRIFYTELGGGGIGGFDNHANQKDNHAALLAQLAEAVAAFVRDLRRDGLLERVLLLTCSEFGRTLAENGRRGTGHGEAAPLFLTGGAVRGGLHGEHPSLTDLDNGALRHHVDFRRLYAGVLGDWLGLDAPALLAGDFPPLTLWAR